MTGELSAYHLYRLTWTLLDWLYPPSCGGCGQKGSRWCDVCSINSRQIPAPVCHYCGQGINKGGLKCYRCQSNCFSFKMARSWAYFDGPIRKALHRLKYNRDIALGDVLARPLIQMIRILDWNVELVIPVPLGVARLKERGYNQAALLARPIALAHKVKYIPNGMKRVRETKTQVGLSLAERRANVFGAFKGFEPMLADKTILLVDDVMTSGATLDACSQAALAAGAHEVYCLTLARAVDTEYFKQAF